MRCPLRWKPSCRVGEQNPGARCFLIREAATGLVSFRGSGVRACTRGENSLNGSDRASSGLTGLDDILGGGFVLGRIHLVEGKAGTGKTTLGMQFILAGRDRGEKVLYITMSETLNELQAVAVAHGWSLEGIEICELVPPDIGSRGRPWLVTQGHRDLRAGAARYGGGRRQSANNVPRLGSRAWRDDASAVR